MTYSHNTSRKPFPSASNPAFKNAAQNDSATSAQMKSVKMWAAVMAGLTWVVQMIVRQQSDGGAHRLLRSKRFRAVMIVLAILLTVLPGTRAEKAARLKHIFKIINARMDA